MSKVASETSPFAAAIVDIGLPDRPGDQLAAEIRAKWPELPIIIASGHDRNELAKRFIGDGHVGVLGKPYDSATLMDALGKLGVTAPSGSRAEFAQSE
jgi:DNA-binding NarL/FixJ family response regulator